MSKKFKTLIMSLAATSLLSACAVNNPKIWEAAKLPKATPATNKLNALPPTSQKVAVAVYGFTDQTGQFKPSDSGQTLSRAVTQGATSILVKSLHEAGNRNWFTVIEREKLDNVLRERAVIREMRASYLGEKTINPQALPPLLFAGVLLEGGIIGFDSNTKTGGSGARFLGIGGRTQYREDTVTVYLRAVSVKTGEVLTSVSTRKSIASVGVGGDAFRFVAFRELLELEAGITYNEPDELALRQTIEAAVYAMIMEGAMQDLWCFSAEADEVRALLTDYIAERDSIKKAKVLLPVAANDAPVPGLCGGQRVTRSQRQQQQIGAARRAPVANKPIPSKPAPNKGQAAIAALPGQRPGPASSRQPVLAVPAASTTSTAMPKAAPPKAAPNASLNNTQRPTASSGAASTKQPPQIKTQIQDMVKAPLAQLDSQSATAQGGKAQLVLAKQNDGNPSLPKGYIPSAPLRSSAAVQSAANPASIAQSVMAPAQQADDQFLPVSDTASLPNVQLGCSLFDAVSWSDVISCKPSFKTAIYDNGNGKENTVSGSKV